MKFMNLDSHQGYLTSRSASFGPPRPPREGPRTAMRPGKANPMVAKSVARGLPLTFWPMRLRASELYLSSPEVPTPWRRLNPTYQGAAPSGDEEDRPPGRRCFLLGWGKVGLQKGRAFFQGWCKMGLQEGGGGAFLG